MARDYTLKRGKNPPADKPNPKLAVAKCKSDYIAMSRAIGDPYTFFFNGEELTGAVHRSWKYLTLISASDGEFYVEDARKPADKQIRQLTDADRCTHCGHYFCTDDCPNYNNEEAYKMSKKDIINISGVLAIEPGTDKEPAWVNDIVDCVITSVKEAKGNGPVKATLTNCEDNGDKITGIFWKRDYEDIAKLEGKLVRMQGGMIRSVYKPEKGPRIQQLAVQAKAEIEVVGESAHSDKPLPHQPSPHRDTPHDAPQRGSVQSGGVLTDVLRRAKCYFGVLLRTEKAYEAAKEAGLQLELTPTDLKDVATHISMTYRGDYGCYAEPIFEKNGSARPSALESQTDQQWDADDQGEHGSRTSPPPRSQSTERVSSWKSFVHPKRGKPLGEIPETDLMGFARYYIGEESPDDKDGKLFYANVKMMMAEKGWSSPSKLLINSVLSDDRYTTEFNDEDINAYFEAEAGKTLDDLDDEEALNFIADYSNVIDGIVKQAGKPKRAAKKSKATMPD